LVALIFCRDSAECGLLYRSAFTPVRFSDIHAARQRCVQNLRRFALLGGTNIGARHCWQVTCTGIEELPDGPLDVYGKIVPQTYDRFVPLVEHDVRRPATALVWLHGLLSFRSRSLHPWPVIGLRRPVQQRPVVEPRYRLPLVGCLDPASIDVECARPERDDVLRDCSDERFPS
jgi:hypothetical protein